MLSAERKFGLVGTCLRKAAAELPDAYWAPTYTVLDKEECVVLATARHCSVPGCEDILPIA